MNAERSPIHIGVNTLFLIPGEVGGSETYLCKTLDAICRNHDCARVTLFSNSENHLFLRSIFDKYMQVNFLKLNFKASNRFIRIIREQFELPFKVKQAKVDVLWSPGYTAPALVHCPQTVTIHDMQYKSHPEDLTWLARITTDLLLKIAGFRAQRFLTISEFSKSEIIHFTNISKEKIDVTYLAANDFAFNNLPDVEVSKSLSKRIPSTQKYILTIANSYPHKNLHTLVEAYGKIIEKIPHRLVIVGKPRLGERLVTKSLSNFSEPDRVIRISGLNQEELIALYQGADLFVFPSLYEGFGLPVLEAMMCKVPVVTTTKGSIPEVGGDFAVYVHESSSNSLADAILDVLAWQPEYRSEFVNKAREWSELFSWDKTAKKTLDALMLTVKILKN